MASSTCSGSVRSRAAASVRRPSRSTMRSKALVPVTASSRRVFEPMDDSETTVMGPIMPSAPTWVPPHNSMEWGPARTTRTRSPYLSPKKARAPMASASALVVSSTTTSASVSTSALAIAATAASSSGATPPWWLKSKRRRSGATSEPCWRTWSPEHGPQGGVEQVGAGVVAAQRVAPDPVDGGQRVLAGEELAGDPGPVGGEAGQGGHGVVDDRGARLGDDGAGVADLAAALGVEGGAVEEDLGPARRGRGRDRPAPPPPGPGRRTRRAAGRRRRSGPRCRAPSGRPARRPAVLADRAAARAWARCRSMAASKPARSTATPASSAISTVSSIGEAVGVVQPEGHVARDRVRPPRPAPPRGWSSRWPGCAGSPPPRGRPRRGSGGAARPGPGRPPRGCPPPRRPAAGVTAPVDPELAGPAARPGG